ncbi:MAG: molybdopterin-binding protein, partial [Bacillota bacterium]
NLLGKTELWVEGVRLAGADLVALAGAVAEELGLREDEVRVTDVRSDVVVLDVLSDTVPADRVVGREAELLARLAGLPGVNVLPGARIHSEGVLGLLVVPPAEAKQVLEESRRLAEELGSRVRSRALVFATGSEVREGAVRDTNTPLIARELGAVGYRVASGPVLPDDPVSIALAIKQGAAEGFGLVVLTGGIGAEDKDCTVEAVLSACEEACAEDVLHFQPGTGRHVRHAVSIAAGRIGVTLVVALPGPTAEVRALMPELCSCLADGCGPPELAKRLAHRLAGEWERAVRARVCKEAGEGGLPGLG